MDHDEIHYSHIHHCDARQSKHNVHIVYLLEVPCEVPQCIATALVPTGMSTAMMVVMGLGMCVGFVLLHVAVEFQGGYPATHYVPATKNE